MKRFSIMMFCLAMFAACGGGGSDSNGSSTDIPDPALSSPGTYPAVYGVYDLTQNNCDFYGVSTLIVTQQSNEVSFFDQETTFQFTVTATFIDSVGHFTYQHELTHEDKQLDLSYSGELYPSEGMIFNINALNKDNLKTAQCTAIYTLRGGAFAPDNTAALPEYSDKYDDDAFAYTDAMLYSGDYSQSDALVNTCDALFGSPFSPTIKVADAGTALVTIDWESEYGTYFKAPIQPANDGFFYTAMMSLDADCSCGVFSVNMDGITHDIFMLYCVDSATKTECAVAYEKHSEFDFTNKDIQ